ncbi:MAG: hypothetical protein ACI4I5_08260 [Acutalibacteraceae bacterium]
MKIRTKLWSVLLAVCMVWTLVPAFGTVVYADGETSCHVSTAQAFADAIGRADKTAPYTVYLDSDITIGRTDIENQDLTIDLCGHTITGIADSNVLFLLLSSKSYLGANPDGTKLTVKNSKGSGQITYAVGSDSSGSMFTMSNKAALVIENGTFILTAEKDGQYGEIIHCTQNSTVDIRGGVFRNETGYERSQRNACIFIRSGTVTAKNAKFSSSSECIYVDSGSSPVLTVDNCSFTAGEDAICLYDGKLTIGNSLITVAKDYSYAIYFYSVERSGYIADSLAAGNNAYVDGVLYTKTNGYTLGSYKAGCRVEIGSPRITLAELRVTPPAVGAVPATYCSSGTYDYSGGSVTWIPKHATFQEGVSYTAYFQAEIDYFDGVFANFLDVTLNGEKASIFTGAGTKKITAVHTFPALTKPETIDTVNITGLAAPVAGATPGNAATTDTRYSVVNTMWDPEPGSTFAENTVYSAVITLEAKSGYQFAADTVFRVGSKTATVVTRSAEEAKISYTFPATESLADPIYAAALSLAVPVAGATPGNAATTDTQYSIVSTVWNPAPGSKFAENTVYKAVVTLKAKSGYQFTAGTVFRVGGKAATVLTRSAEEAKISVSFPATLKIPTLAIRNNPGSRTVNYGDGIFFVAVYTDLPDGAQIRWFVDDVEKSTGELFSYGNIKKNATVTVKLTDAEGTVLTDADGAEISDSETIQVKAGFFKKLLNFFKNLFRVSRIVAQTITEN